nr:SCP2 sterol-binding domain-containing protein [Nannocystis pusilla]
MERRFDPAAAGDLQAVIQWVLTGDKACAYFAEIKGGSVQRVAGTHPAPTITIEMSAEDYLLMINGELNGARAFSTGRGRLRGPVRLAMKMQRLFPLEAAV